MEVFCPKHKNEKLRRLYTTQAKRKRPTKNNPTGKSGQTTRSSWFLCRKCDKPYKIKIAVIR